MGVGDGAMYTTNFAKHKNHIIIQIITHDNPFYFRADNVFAL